MRFRRRSVPAAALLAATVAISVAGNARAQAPVPPPTRAATVTTPATATSTPTPAAIASASPTTTPAATASATPVASVTPAVGATPRPSLSPTPAPTPAIPTADAGPTGFSVTFPTDVQYAPVGQEITFTVDTPTAGAVYVWSFGDGGTPVTGVSVKHTFATVDDVTVTLAGRSPSGEQKGLASRDLRVGPEMRGVFASDIDGQITPADQFQLAVAVRAPGLSKITARISGTLTESRTGRYDIAMPDNFLVFDNVSVADERDPIIREEILRKPGGSVPLDSANVTLALDYTLPSGKDVTLNYTPSVRDLFAPEKTFSVVYPKVWEFAGKPDDPVEVDGYFLKGDTDFSHTDDWYVRRMAIEWGRRGGAWPDDPAKVSANVFAQVDAVLGDGDPGDFNSDYNLARLFDDGTLSRTRRNGDYICIAQAYLLSAIGRTLGVPAREINNAIGEPRYQRADGVWEVRWFQNAGSEWWYNGAWHYLDTWIGVTDRSAYLTKNLIYQAWATYNQQATPFLTVNGQPTGLRGHNFNAWPGDPPQFTFIEEGVRPGYVVEGMVSGPAAAAISGTTHPDGTWVAAAPPAAGILNTPLISVPREPADTFIATAP